MSTWPDDSWPSPEERPSHLVAYQIRVERQKQIAAGYDAAHDDLHAHREIISAPWGALCRLEEAFGSNFAVPGYCESPYRDRLIQVAAMIVAEIERVDRAAALTDPKASS